MSDAPAVFVDTNVLTEIYTIADLDQSFERLGRLDPLRISRACGSLWLAMCFDREAVFTGGLATEANRILERLAPPQGPIGAWTSFVIHFMRRFVFPRWKIEVTKDDQAIRGDNCDSLLIELGRRFGAPIVSRDYGLRRRAAAVGVVAEEPETFAARYSYELDDARTEFFRRFDAHRLEYTIRCVVAARPPSEDAFVNRARFFVDAIHTVRELYERLWA